jgi:hypothetical protein
MPNETYTPLVVDPNRVLSLPIRFQRFEPIAGWDAKIVEYAGLIQKTKLPQRAVLNIRRQFPASPAGLDQFCLGIGKALDHDEL